MNYIAQLFLTSDIYLKGVLHMPNYFIKENDLVEHLILLKNPLLQVLAPASTGTRGGFRPWCRKWTSRRSSRSRCLSTTRLSKSSFSDRLNPMMPLVTILQMPILAIRIW